MRSSNCKHYAKKEKTNKKYGKAASIVAAVVIAFSAIVIPGTTIIQNVEAVTSVKNTAFSIGGTETFSNVIVESCNAKSDLEEAEKKETPAKTKSEKKVSPKKEVMPVQATEAPTVEETTVASEVPTEVATEAPSTMAVTKSQGLLSIVSADTSYQPQHVSISADQRDKLERLVMGEAGSLGYNGCALVAQAIRDSMVESGTTSVDAIINEYQYTASLSIKPNSAVKKAVSFIFDNDGYAVQHRILYFYASNVVSNPWHESQNFIISYGNVRFFDKW